MILADVSTNDTLIICTTITAIPATIAAVVGYLNHRQIRTPSGDRLGVVLERAHDTGIANNLILGAVHKATKTANPDELHQAEANGPVIPDNLTAG